MSYGRVYVVYVCVCGCVRACPTALKDFDEVLTKRARHVVTEIQRTFEAAEALKRRDFKKVSVLPSQTSINRNEPYSLLLHSPFHTIYRYIYV